jgi:excinuclease ABC subunit C
VLLPQEIEEMQIIREWLNTKRGGKKVEIHIPREGPQQELIQMAAENASATLEALEAQWQADTHRQEQSLAELKTALNLPEVPNRIECYDISNTQGTSAVGSMVVFGQGVPRKNLYRRFNIRSVSGPDDFASMEEVLTRRFNRWKAAQELAEIPGEKPDPAFAILPDLLIVDGGKGQLGRAVKVLEQFDLTRFLPPCPNEELFVPDNPAHHPAIHSQALYLIQVRDEAHRFAITAHRSRRDKAGVASV